MWRLRALSKPPWKGCHDIKLHGGTSKVLLGRNKLTGIKDVRCSREQVQVYLKHSASDASCWCRFLGTSAGEINSVPTTLHTDYQLQTGDTIHLLPSLYAFEVVHVKAATASLESQSTLLPSSSNKRTPTLSDGAPSPQRAKRDSHSLVVPPLQAELKLRKQLRLKGHAIPLATGWQCYADSVLIKEYGAVQHSSKVAAFDFDGCLASTSQGGYDPKAWSLRFKQVPDVLRAYHDNGYKIVIVTNESLARLKNFEPIRKHVAKKCGRLDGFVASVDVPITVFCSLLKDRFRKPESGVWDLLNTHFNGKQSAAVPSSLYVGDAAGRPGDFSDSDRMFAAAVGVRFYDETSFFKASTHPVV
eukprot:m.22269 g.22269  ORF g.22269 m.22269 type:complete len:359 (+) comp11226_c0_seq2:649-1725(+)